MNTPPRVTITRRLVAGSVLLVLVGGVTLAMASVHYPYGPPASKTGAPAVGGSIPEPNCTSCHFPTSGPNLNVPGGMVEILDLPQFYSLGRTYTLRVRLSSTLTAADTARRWGFQLTAVQASSGDGIGTFAVRGTGTGAPGDSLRLVNDPGPPWPTRWYVEHSIEGVKDSTASPAEWSFQWTAPVVPSGNIYFFAAGNSADGSQDQTGDWIFTTRDTLRDTTTAVRSVSWGSLKQRWR